MAKFGVLEEVRDTLTWDNSQFFCGTGKSCKHGGN